MESKIGDSAPREPLRERLVASPCCLPQLALVPLLDLYEAIGFRKIELFTSWARSAVDFHENPATLRSHMDERGMRVTSVHLPPVNSARDSVQEAIRAARFAAALGAEVVLFKAESFELYAAAAGEFLDGIEDLRITPVVQNHAGSAISTLNDFRKVMDAVGDPRMGSLLDIGHLVRAGEDWRAGLALLRGTLGLVHVNDIDAEKSSVPFGTGVVDFRALLARLRDTGYAGNIVVELEMAGHDESIEPTASEVGRAMEYLCEMAG